MYLQACCVNLQISVQYLYSPFEFQCQPCFRLESAEQTRSGCTFRIPLSNWAALQNWFGCWHRKQRRAHERRGNNDLSSIFGIALDRPCPKYWSTQNRINLTCQFEYKFTSQNPNLYNLSFNIDTFFSEIHPNRDFWIDWKFSRAESVR